MEASCLQFTDLSRHKGQEESALPLPSSPSVWINTTSTYGKGVEFLLYLALGKGDASLTANKVHNTLLFNIPELIIPY